MKNPFEGEEEDNLENYPPGYYYNIEHKQLIFIDIKESWFVGKYYRVYFRENEGDERLDSSMIHKIAKPLEFDDIKNDVEGFVKDVRWLKQEKVYHHFIKFLLDNELYRIIGFCKNCENQSTNGEKSSKEKT